MSSTVRILSSRERVVFFSFLFSCLCVTDCFSFSPVLFIIYYCEYIYSPHRTKITSDVGRAVFHWKGKREKQRTALLCLFTSIPISTQKMVPEKSQQQMSLLKKKKNHLPVSLHNPFLDVKMENSSSEDLSEVLQQWPKTEGSLIVLLLWNSLPRSFKCLLYFF